ncbi:MAG: DUF6527 family protein [Candidatus Angelobacter sp.]
MNIKLQRVHKIPPALQPGILYVSEEYEIAMHICPCGCGWKVSTPLGLTDWSFEDGRRGPSLYPSIGNWQKPCQSHYWIRDGEIIWAPKWTPQEILEGHRKEQELSSAYFRERDRRRNRPLGKLWNWLARPFQRK